MKKIVLATALMVSAISSAHAYEAGVTVGRDFSGPESATVGVTVSEKFGKIGAAVGYDRNIRDGYQADRFSLIGSYDVYKYGKFTVSPKAGVAYVNPETGNDGYGWLVGAGVKYDLNANLAVGVDYRYFVNEKDVRGWEGGQLLLGVSYKF